VLVLGELLSYFTGQIVTPLSKLQFAVQTFAEGQLTEDLNINSGDEVEELAASFRQMTTKIHSLIENIKIEQNKQENFFNQMTHEFRTPLTTIIGYADIINKMGSAEERTECSKYIISESKRLLRMVDDILGSSMMKTFSLNLNKTRSDLDQLLRESIQIMKYKADKYGVELNLFAEKAISFEFDRDKIKQVILNIIDNAINHSKTEQVDINLYQRPKKVVISIRDYGQGINNQRLEQIQKRCSGMDMSQIPTSGGHGFGLPLSLKIMNLHNGKLLIRTAEDGGTTVYLIFR
jgi:signal transduction histidine kinase